MLDLTARQLLTTTRAVRKRLDFDRPVELDVIKECLEDALQAPTGSNAQDWHFMVVQDKSQREALADVYKQGFAAYRNMPMSVYAYADRAEGERKGQFERVGDSAGYLAEHIHRAPILIVPCIEGRVDTLPPPMGAPAQASKGASIFPAVWSFMLAARLRGLGTCMTTVHLLHEQKAAEVLGIPYHQISQMCLLPVAYTKGTDFKPAKRQPLSEVMHLDDWGSKD